MHNKACHNMTNTHRTLIKNLLDFNTSTLQPYTLRIIYLINLFFCEFLCPERQNYLKNLCFLFFFPLRKKHPGNKYFGKILEFARYPVIWKVNAVALFPATPCEVSLSSLSTLAKPNPLPSEACTV